MVQSSFALMTNLGRAKEAAALANATTIEITHIAIGDGTTVPSGGETALYNEIARKTISGHGTVVGASNVAYFDAFLAADDGPYTIREAGLYDDDGDLIAIAHYDPAINKPIPSSGQTVEGSVRLEVAFSDVANITIKVDPAMLVALQRLTRLPWVPIISMSLASPPASPVVGDTYVIATSPTGSWAGQAGRIAEYTSAGWAIISPPNGHGVSLPGGRLYMRIAGIYIEYLATEAFSGLVKVASEQDVKNAVGAGVVRAEHMSSYVAKTEPGQTLWVRLDGNDANDGSANTGAAAFKTITGALAYIQSRFGTPGRPIIIQIGTPGTYDTAPISNIPAGLTLRGDPAAQDDYILTGPAGLKVIGASVTLEGLRLNYAPGAVQHNLQVGSGGNVLISSTTFSGSPQTSWSHVYSAAGGQITILGTAIKILMSAHSALLAQGGGNISFLTGAAISFGSGVNPEFSAATVCADTSGSVSLGGGGFSYTAIGKRYRVAMCGTINTSGGGASFIPGTIAGTEETGGQYA